MSGITITGRMVECGDFQGDGGKTAFVTIMLANGSHVSVIGLTHQEVREISGSFMAPLDITLAPGAVVDVRRPDAKLQTDHKPAGGAG